MSLKEAKIKETFKTDELIEAATSLFAVKSGGVAEIDTEVERVATLGIFKNIQGAAAASINHESSQVDDTGNSDTETGAMEG